MNRSILRLVASCFVVLCLGGLVSVQTAVASKQQSASDPTVTFNANGGTGTMDAQTANVQTALTANAFTRSGYAFTSWNTAANGSGTTYLNRAMYPFAMNATLYAQWSLCTLNFQGAPASPTPPPACITSPDWAGYVDVPSGQAIVPSGTTVAAASNGRTITMIVAQRRINVASTTGFPTSGQINLVSNTGTAALTYTEKTSTSFGNGAPGSIMITPGSMTMGAWTVRTGGQVTLGPTVTQVVGSWEQPAMTCNQTNPYNYDMNIWVGIDGTYGSSDVEQTGTEAQCGVTGRSTIGADSNGKTISMIVSDHSLSVGSADGFPASGQINVAAKNGNSDETVILSYYKSTSSTALYIVANVTGGNSGTWTVMTDGAVTLNGGNLRDGVAYTAWWEVFPSAPGYFTAAALPVAPGNTFTATVTYSPTNSVSCPSGANGQFTLTVRNTSANKMVSVIYCGSPPTNSTAAPVLPNGANNGFVNGAHCSANTNSSISDCVAIPARRSTTGYCLARPNICQRGTAEWIVEPSSGRRLAQFATVNLTSGQFSTTANTTNNFTLQNIDSPAPTRSAPRWLDGTSAGSNACCAATVGALTTSGTGFPVSWVNIYG